MAEISDHQIVYQGQNVLEFFEYMGFKCPERKGVADFLQEVNQIGTVTEAIEAVKLAKDANWGVVTSHGCGETEDSFIADLAVGLSTGQIKAGAPSRGERLATYNQLLRIEEQLGDQAVYAGENWRVQ